MLSQVGLLLFMFLVGLELDPELLRGRGRAVVTSHASILAPFVLGAALALFLYPRLGESVSLTGFALFLGAAMSVTAFPVLARILAERGPDLRTRSGAMAMACAAVDDVTAWCLLAVVVAIVAQRGGGVPLWLSGGHRDVLFWCAGARSRAGAAMRRVEATTAAARLTHDVLRRRASRAAGSAWATERLGIHALFGAFLSAR